MAPNGIRGLPLVCMRPKTTFGIYRVMSYPFYFFSLAAMCINLNVSFLATVLAYEALMIDLELALERP